MGSRVLLSGYGGNAGHVLLADVYGNGDYDTIQAALDAANAETPTSSAQWLVLVAPGMYAESLTLYDYVNIAACSPDKGAYLNQTGAAAILNAAECTISGLRIKSSASPMVTTGMGAAGKTLRLIDIDMEVSTVDIDGLYVGSGSVYIERCRLQAGGWVIYLGENGAVHIHESRIRKYFSGSGSGFAAIVSNGGMLRAYRSTIENASPEGEGIKFLAAPGTMAKLVDCIIKKSAAATYSIEANATSSCLVLNCCVNAEVNAGMLTQAVDYTIEDDL